MAEKKVIIFGLDCATPQLVFDRWASALPNLAALRERGIAGPLQSCIPPITIPAWTCMLTSKNPGKLGCYGFRNRSDYSYEGLSFATSKVIKEPAVWDVLARYGKKVILLGIPQTYPPKPVNGIMVSCFLTPDTSSRYTYPAEVKQRIAAEVGEYILDVDNFRTEDKTRLLTQIYEMTEKRFKLFRAFLRDEPWDFAMLVEMGIDRIHHGFWKFMDTSHPKYEPGNPYENAIRDYYRFIDRKIGEVLSCVDPATAVLVVSDHGAQTMRGGICINEWLQQEGYLHIADQPPGIVPLHKAVIDWKHTRAWGEGGYYARVFLNVAGREPLGIIPPQDYEKVRAELTEKLEALGDERGNAIGTRVIRPQDAYPVVNGVPPDLIVYFGNLTWRAVGSIGLQTIHTFENDTGPDDANHAEQGIFIMYDPARTGDRKHTFRDGLSLVDVAPTVLSIMGIPVPPDMEGKVIQ